MFDVKVITNQDVPVHLNHGNVGSRERVKQARSIFKIGTVVRSKSFEGFGRVIGYNIAGYGRHYADRYPLLVKDPLGKVHTFGCDEVELVVLSK